ncbi:hypothetical protein AB987_2383 [Acinetobacter baumannii]|nr:hypothetical protein AB987_2383 [Acinetobacter baumannii]
MGNIINLSFKQLTIVSNSQKSANQFNFHPKYNLITGSNNSIGKSTLAKLLLWSMGCSPNLDKTWKNLDIKSLLIFNIGDKEYSVSRYGNQIFFKQPSQAWQVFEKISGLYSELFAQIMKFHVLLPNKTQTTKLETPPPSYYFLPFYIDQKISWTSTWSGFANLSQYSNWRDTVIKYHTGYIDSQYFELQEKIYEKLTEKKSAEEKVKSLETSISVISTYIPTNSRITALTPEDLNKLYQLVTEDLKDLQNKQENFFSLISEQNASKVYYQSQLDLAKLAAHELEKDYRFSVENINNDSIFCPICGTEHDNSIVSRASILADKAEADEQIKSIQKKLDYINHQIIKNSKLLEDVEHQINLINQKYDSSLTNSNMSENISPNILEEIATSTIQIKVHKTINQENITIKTLEKDIKINKKEQKKLSTIEIKESLDAAFKLSLSSYIKQLDATTVNLADISSALNANRMHDNGGAAESTRGLLAYYYAVLKQIYNANNEVFAPIIIDTPNQQEQANFNYSKILDFIIRHTPSTSQLIICAMDRSEIQEYKDQANTIFLTENKLLDTKKYKELKTLFTFETFST